MPPMTPTIPRIHDLLEIDAERFLQAQSSAPSWVAASLRETPFVVVRRGAISTDQGIAVGVRGAQRNERWAGVCHPDLVGRILTPPMLLSRLIATSPAPPVTDAPAASSSAPASPSAAAVHPTPASSSALACHPAPAAPSTSASRPLPPTRTNTIPALRALALLADRWKELDSLWGPGGSVAFELATAHPVATPQSDLDIVIYAESRITHDAARALWESAQGLPAAVDIRVETPTCGFSLTEYANRAPMAPILLRFPYATALGPDPWATELAMTSTTPTADEPVTRDPITKDGATVDPATVSCATPSP
jgi:phosphoribosyl-dephospho-CoA transferase